MPIKMPNAPDFVCHDCGHPFRRKLWQRLLPGKSPAARPLPRKCPKCGSTDIRLLTY